MSKKVKALVERDIGLRLADIDGVAVINPRGLAATKTNMMRRRLRDKGLRMTVVKNTLARRAVGDGKLKGFDKLLDGPSAVIYGKSTAIAIVARTLLEEKKNDDTLDLRGIFFDGEVYLGEAGIKVASKLPTREEAISQLVGLILSPASNLAGALLGPGGTLAGVVKAIEEKVKAAGGDPVPAAEAPVAEAPVVVAPAAEAPADAPPAA